MTFSEKIMILRRKAGMTQDIFANAVGVSRQAVYKWECGISYPEAQKLVEIKKLFGISIDLLLDDSREIDEAGMLSVKRVRPKTAGVGSVPVYEAEETADEKEFEVEISVKEEPATPVYTEEAKQEKPASVSVAAEAPAVEKKPAAPVAQTVRKPVRPEAKKPAPIKDTKKKSGGFFAGLFKRK